MAPRWFGLGNGWASSFFSCWPVEVLPLSLHLVGFELTLGLALRIDEDRRTSGSNGNTGGAESDSFVARIGALNGFAMNKRRHPSAERLLCALIRLVWPQFAALAHQLESPSSSAPLTTTLASLEQVGEWICHIQAAHFCELPGRPTQVRFTWPE